MKEEVKFMDEEEKQKDIYYILKTEMSIDKYCYIHNYIAELQQKVILLNKQNEEIYEKYCNELKIKNKAIEYIEKQLSTETYQHLKSLYDDIENTEEVWEEYEFEDILEILKGDSNE